MLSRSRRAEEFEKSYSSVEAAHREKIFKANLKTMIDHNGPVPCKQWG